MKTFLLVLTVFVLSLAIALPTFASGDHACEHDGVTIASLEHCVYHATEMGHITNQGVAKSLLAKLAAAQAASDRSQPDVAVRNLQAFVNGVNAQAGKHIDAEHADHLVMHAASVIAALSH